MSATRTGPCGPPLIEFPDLLTTHCCFVTEVSNECHNGVVVTKSVLLFKSKPTAESKSFCAEFIEEIETLKKADISSTKKGADT